jgi:DNA modification methylase
MTVLDNCAGSGTTALAAINSGRSWVCIEKDVNYAEIAIERINASRMQQEQSNPLEEIGQ